MAEPDLVRRLVTLVSWVTSAAVSLRESGSDRRSLRGLVDRYRSDPAVIYRGGSW